MAKPSRRTRQEQKLPKKKVMPSASSLEAARRLAAGDLPSRADEVAPREDDAGANTRPAKARPAAAATTSKKRAPREARASDEDVELSPAIDPALASRGRAARFVAFGIVVLAVIAGVTWLADRKPTAVKSEAGPMPSLKPGDQVNVFDPDFEKKKEEDRKAAEKAAKPAPTEAPREIVADPAPAPAPTPSANEAPPEKTAAAPAASDPPAPPKPPKAPKAPKAPAAPDAPKAPKPPKPPAADPYE